MAVGTIISVLSNIPWGKVLETAPKVAEGASKLWSAVKDRTNKDSIEDGIEASATNQIPTEADVLNQRMLELEGNVRSLQDQMQAATELTKALAEQNTTLVQRVELNRKRFVRFALGTIAGGATLLAVVIYALVRA